MTTLLNDKLEKIETEITESQKLLTLLENNQSTEAKKTHAIYTRYLKKLQTAHARTIIIKN